MHLDLLLGINYTPVQTHKHRHTAPHICLYFLLPPSPESHSALAIFPTYLHTPATCSYTQTHTHCSLKLFGFIKLENTTPHSARCQFVGALQIPVCPPKLQPLVPQGLLLTFITLCSMPGGCLHKSSFP